MNSDPLLDEIRAFREEYAKRFNYDMRAIVRDLKEDAERKGLKLVSLDPRRLTQAEAVSKPN